MSPPAFPSPLHEGAGHNSSQLPLIILQVLAQLQQSREFAKSQSLKPKSEFHHKEHLRRMEYEQERDEQLKAYVERTQTALENAADLQRLLEISKKEVSAAVEEARGYKELSGQLQQELELERNKSSSLQDLLVRNVTTGLNNFITMTAENQVGCLKEKHALQEKLEDEKRKFEEEKNHFRDVKLKFGEEKQELQQKLVDEKRKYEEQKHALQEKLKDETRKFEDEERRCSERNSATNPDVLTVLQQLKDTTSANRRLSEYVKQTLLADLQRSVTSLQSSFSSLPAQLEHLKKEQLNNAKNWEKYIIRPKENLKLLTRVLKGRTEEDALILAAKFGNITALEILLDSGANIESIDDTYKGTPLKWAAANGLVEACRLLIERGADLGPGIGNYTALHSAAANNKLEVVKLLVEMGADVTTKNANGQTPAEMGNETIKAWFSKRP